MSYQHEREDFIVRMIQEGLPIYITRGLLAGANTLQRLAELACSSEAADRDRIPCPATRTRPGECLCDLYQGQHQDIPRITWHAWQKERRLQFMLPEGWQLQTHGDPRGYVVRVIPPSYATRNAGRDAFNLDSIGVPTR